MFEKNVDDRLSSWAEHRTHLNHSNDPLAEVWEFWQHAPYIPYNNKVDPYYKQSWPSPWEMIVDNKYDDFTKAVMIAWTLKLTKKFENSKIEIKTYIENTKQRLAIMRETTDGFEIARRDLEIRGPGEFLGARQSGQAMLRFANLETDQWLVEKARDLAADLLLHQKDIAEAHLARWLGSREDFLRV